MAADLVRGEDCSVCHEAFKEPKILPCGHVVCRPCLVSWIRNQPQAGCPLCRYAVFETEGQPRILEEKVEALPTDLALAELVEARALLDKDHTCCVCEDGAATALCLHCGDMLCASCRKAHEKMKVSQHHNVDDLRSLTPESLAASRPLPCSGHPHEASRLFCPTHNTSVCFQCATAEHKSCLDMQDVEERTEEARASLAEMAASFVARETEINEAIQQLERHIKDTDDGVQAAIVDIRKTSDRLESSVHSWRNRMTDRARDEGADIKERAQAAITILQGRKGHVTSHTVVARRAERGTQHVTMTNMSSVLETRLEELDFSAILPASAKVVSRLEFVTEDTALTRVEEALAELVRVRLVRESAISQAGVFEFHENHGPRIILSDGRQTVTCKGASDYGDGIVVSREILTANVLYEVRLGQSPGWMAVGVLTDSPDNVTLTGESDHLLPATAVSSSGVKQHGTEGYVEHHLKSEMEELGQGDRVGVSLDTSHGLPLHVNGEDRGVWAQHITGPCHALLDLGGYGQDDIQVTALLPTTLEGREDQRACETTLAYTRCTLL